MYYIYSLLLAVFYLGYYVIIKNLLQHFNVKEIIFGSYIFTFFLVMILFYKDIINFFNKISKLVTNQKNDLINFNLVNIIGILLLAIVMVSSNYIGVLACSTNYNFGNIDALASSIYLPIVAIISYYIYNNPITIKNAIGILFACISIFLLV